MGRTPVMIYHQKNLYSLDGQTQTLRRRLRLEVHLYQLKRQPNSLFAPEASYDMLKASHIKIQPLLIGAHQMPVDI